MADLGRNEIFRKLMEWRYVNAKNSSLPGGEEEYDENSPWYQAIKDVELNGCMLLDTVRKLAHGRRCTKEDVLFSPQMELEAERFCIGPIIEEQNRDDPNSRALVVLDRDWKRMSAAKSKKDACSMMDHNEKILECMREIRKPAVIPRFLEDDHELLDPNDIGSYPSGPSSCADVNSASENGPGTDSESDKEETTKAKRERMKRSRDKYLAVPGRSAEAGSPKALPSRAGSINSDGGESDGRLSAIVPSITFNAPPERHLMMEEKSSYFAGEFGDLSLNQEPSQ